MLHKAFLGAAISVVVPVSAMAADLATQRVTAPATLERGSGSSALTPQRVLKTGDTVAVGSRGKVTVQLGGTSLVTVASLGELQIFDSKAGSAGSPGIGRFKLVAGAVRVDSRAGNKHGADDIRLNIGSLKTRIQGASAWGANTVEGETLCVISGAVSVQTEGNPDRRIDTAGSCLRREPDGQLNTFAAASDALVTAAMNASQPDGSLAVLNTPAAATPDTAPASAPEKAAKVEKSEKAPAPEQAPVAISTAPAATAGNWTLVVLSLATAAPVEAKVAALNKQGLAATVRTASVNGQTVHRATVGSFASQAEARAYAADTLAKAGIKAWALRL